MNVIVHKFCMRVFDPSTPYTHWSGSTHDLEQAVLKGWEKRAPGDKPGSWLVPLDAGLALVPYRTLRPGEVAEVSFDLRSADFPEEGCRISAPRTDKGERQKGRFVRAIVYESATLAVPDPNGNTYNTLEAEADNFEIIAVEASMTENDPAHYNTVLYNEWAPGGTKSGVLEALNINLDAELQGLDDLDSDEDYAQVVEALQARIDKARNHYLMLIESHKMWNDKVFIKASE